MDLVIYTRKCLACTNKPLWKNIKQFAKLHDLTIQENRVTKNESLQQKADSYEIALPFVVLGGVALSLNEPLERLL